MPKQKHFLLHPTKRIPQRFLPALFQIRNETLLGISVRAREKIDGSPSVMTPASSGLASFAISTSIRMSSGTFGPPVACSVVHACSDVAADFRGELSSAK